MFITPSFKKSLIVEQFQGNYLKLKQLDYWLSISKCDSWLAIEISSSRSNCLAEMTMWSFPQYGRVFYSHPSFWKKPLMVMCLMSDDFNVFKIHVMMTSWTRHVSLKLWSNIKTAFLCLITRVLSDLSKVYKIAMTTIDYVHYSRRRIVGFILLFWSWKKDRLWFSAACARLVNFVVWVSEQFFRRRNERKEVLQNHLWFA